MNKQKTPVIFGEVLYDCFPDGERVLGGAPFNVAWHCQAFGLNPIFISRVGNDQTGRQIRSAMLDWGMDTKGLQLDNTHPTGIVEVKFVDGEPSYDIIENSAWDFIDKEELPKIDDNIMLYHGSLALRNMVSASALNQLKVEFNPAVFVDVNLRAPWWSKSTINKIISECTWLKLNEEELSLLVPDTHNLEESMEKLVSRNSLDLLIVTQGEHGVTAVESELNKMKVVPELNNQVIDTVGAGDAFSSIILVGLYNNWPLGVSLQRAQEFASAIVGIQGATINNIHFYQPFIENWQLRV